MRPAAQATTTQHLPLCVDLDGTLIRSDLFFESFLLLIRTRFWAALQVPFWLLMHGKAATKLRIATLVDIEAATLPYSWALVQHLREQKATGRRLILATASARRYADAIAEHLSLFDEVLATDVGTGNLSRDRKAATLLARYTEGFEYIGNSRDDLPVWAVASAIGVVNASPRVRAAAQSIAKPVLELPRTPTSAAVLKAIRPHQWLKNLLVFVPLIASHQLDAVPAAVNALLAFVAFSLCASSVYVLNDLLDIQADRAHPRKRFRPFAAGSISVPIGVALKLSLLGASILVAFQLSWAYITVLAVYYLLTFSYSVRLKAQVIVDVMMLSALYTVRLIAGGVATGIALSFWLLAFSMFVFLSLALLKRYSEMRMLARGEAKRSAGRGYSTDDLVVLLALGTASAYSAVLVLALYVNSGEVSRLYPNPQFLWACVPLLAYWMSRIWLKAHRGEVHDDPVVFAAKDWQSQLLTALVVFLGALATGALGLPL
jgi:4-hydroxybenzoate polyprenyltransferase/phosphoserine phosphatase